MKISMGSIVIPQYGIVAVIVLQIQMDGHSLVIGEQEKRDGTNQLQI